MANFTSVHLVTGNRLIVTGSPEENLELLSPSALPGYGMARFVDIGGDSIWIRPEHITHVEDGGSDEPMVAVH